MIVLNKNNVFYDIYNAQELKRYAPGYPDYVYKKLFEIIDDKYYDIQPFNMDDEVKIMNTHDAIQLVLDLTGAAHIAKYLFFQQNVNKSDLYVNGDNNILYTLKSDEELIDMVIKHGNNQNMELFFKDWSDNKHDYVYCHDYVVVIRR